MFAVISTVGLCSIAFYYNNEADTYIEESRTWKRHTDTSERFFCWAKRCAFVLFISFFIHIFVPTTNDTAKQLPDKCIKALDEWVENLNAKEKQEKEVE